MLHRFSTEPFPGAGPRYWLLVILIQINNSRYPGLAPGEVPVLNPCSGWVPLYIHIFDIIHQHFPPLIFVNYRCTIYCNTGTKPETISRLFGCQYFPMTHVILTL